MYFTELKKIQPGTPVAEITRSLQQYRCWLENNNEGLSIYQYKVLNACLNYADKAFTLSETSEKSYRIFNNIFAIALQTINNDKAFFDRVEMEFIQNYDQVLGIYNSENEKYKDIINELKNQKNCYIYTLELDEKSDMSKAIKGFKGSIATAASILSFVCVAKGKYRDALLLLAASKCFNELASKNRCLEPSAAANMVYHAPKIVKEGMAAVSEYVPANALTRMVGLFSPNLSESFNYSGISTVKIPVFR